MLRLTTLLPLLLLPLLMAPDCDGGGSSETPAPPEDPGEPEDGAVVEAVSFPTLLRCGRSAEGSVTLRNEGSTTWTRGDSLRLGAWEDGDPFYHLDTRVDLPDDATVPPGGSFTFPIPMEAPVEPGVYKTDWQMVREGVHWFGEVASADVEVTCDPIPGEVTPRHGLVRLNGRVLSDDDGPFVALGASFFWGAWGYRNDRERLEQNLEFLSEHGFDYIRVLGVVGDPAHPDSWDGREVDEQWPDYDEVIAGLTDLAYDVYGLRVEWTLIGDGQVTVPTTAEKQALVDRFLAMSVGREHKIMHFEIANESWQNGFGGDDGLALLRQLSRSMKDRTDILVAASAPAGSGCEDVQAMYEGNVADLATIHFERTNNLTDGGWRPVRQPWEHQFCSGVPAASNNEPIGPGSSVASENDPIRLVAAAVTSWVAGLPMYVWHSAAGVRGFSNLWEMAGGDAFVEMRGSIPGSLPGWTQKNAHWSDSPFRPYAEDSSGLHADQMWPDLASPTAGAVRAYGAIQGNNYVVFPIGIRDHVKLEARRALTYEVVDPMTGDLLAAGVLAAGQSFDARGREALIVTGAFQ